MENPGDTKLAKALAALTRYSLAHPGVILGLTALLTAFSAWATWHLRLDTDLKSLLPPHTPSVTRLEDLASRIGGQSDLIVEIRSPDPEANKRFGAAIAGWLEQRPDMRFTIFRRDKQVLERSVLLFLTVDKLDDLRERVKERIRREVRKQLAVEEGSTSGDEEADDAADDDPFERAKKKPAVAAATGQAAGGADAWTDDDLTLNKDKLRERFKDVDIPEYFTADEGRVLVVKARPSFSTTEVKQTRAMIADARAEIERLAPASFHPQMEVRLEGLYADMTGQVNTMKNDVLGSTAICMAILLVVIVLYFRRLRPLLYIFVPLVASTLWSLGVAWALFGGLNLGSAVIFAILLGLGIDFGIHMVARFREEVSVGVTWREAYLRTVTTTGVSVFTGATTTAVVFFLLAVAHFEGFRQFGVIAGSGVCFSLLAIFTITPALLALLEPRRPWNPHWTGRHLAEGSLRPAYTWALVVVVLVTGVGFAAFSAWHLPDVGFEYDFGRLGPRSRFDPEKQKRVDFREAVGRVTTGAPAVIMAESPADAEALTRDLARVPEAPPDPDGSHHVASADALPSQALRDLVGRFDLETVDTLGLFLSKTLSLYTFVPEGQPEKLEILKDIRRRLEQKRGLFKGKDLEDLDEFLAHVATEPLTVDKLPDWIRAQFRTVDGREGTFVLLYTRGSKDSYVNASRLKKALFDLKLPDGRTVETAANYFVLADVVDTVIADAPPVLVLSFGVILLLVALQLRRTRDVALVMLPLVFALLWMAGYLYDAGAKLNFYNMILFPLLIGMGVDASVHVVARYREEGRGSLFGILRETGGATFMCALTTAIGFGGVYYADHQGLNSLGTLGIVGIFLAFGASLALLPALLWLGERLRPGRDGRA